MGFDPSNTHFAAGFGLGLAILHEQQARGEEEGGGGDWRALQSLLASHADFVSRSPESWRRTPGVYRQVLQAPCSSGETFFPLRT